MKAWPGRLARAMLAAAGLAGAGAHAQEAQEAAPFGPPVGDDRVYLHALLDELEGRFGGGAGAALRWDGEAWLGTDTDRLWLKSEGFVQDGQVQDGNQELLYDRPISTYADLQAGLRYDLDSAAGRGWAALGIEGLAPYFLQYSGTLYASDGGHFAGRLVLRYDAVLTQRLVLEPAVELNAYTRSDPARGVGCGLSEVDAGLRLRYELSRKFTPYAGLVYERRTGPAGVAAGDTRGAGRWRLAVGIRGWL